MERDKFLWSGGFILYPEAANGPRNKKTEEISPYVKIKRDGWPTLRIATSK